MSVTKVPAETAAALQRPVWLRAGFTAAFGAFATFWTGNAELAGLWGENAFVVGKVVMAAFFVLASSMVWEYGKNENVPEKLRTALAAGAALWALSGVVVIFMTSSVAVAVAAGIGLLSMGAAELIGGIRVRHEFVPARDHITVGTVTALTGVALFIWHGPDLHAVAGTAGMGMILAAALLLISAAGLTHEARQAKA
ncbi:hypothetical protein [Nesterenkonia populi]|uniref:hypothetical protein n=1 Tax=Nesterenkonia populi TaxID=1591087 RepID=UPI0011BF2C6D|nr:hypothetical protein [Nesterenkonia populi]